MNATSYIAKQARADWRLAGIRHTTVYLPDELSAWIKGMIDVVNAKALLDAVERHDEDVLAAFGDKQPRLPFDVVDLAKLAAANDSADPINVETDEISGLLLERAAFQAAASKAAEEGDTIRAQYWFAKDYATAMLARGKYKMLKERVAGRYLEL